MGAKILGRFFKMLGGQVLIAKPKNKTSASPIGRFVADARAIVTVQTVIFSIMLFGGVGLMMDFGRAYSAHSQMQGYIDQVALAAARQLDGKPDAIARATTAANAVSKGSTFVSGSGAFGVSDLVFMTDTPTTADGSFSPTIASNLATSIPEKAKYVLAIASTESVTLTLLRFATEGNSGMTSIDLVTSAVATSRQVACDSLTPMVMCNPFETASNTSWQAQMEDSIGYRMKLSADQTPGLQPTNASSGIAGSGNYNHIRLGLLKRPIDLMEVRNLACEDASLLPGYGASSAAVEELRDICMLAVAASGMSCVNDQVAIKAADPHVVTTGLNVIFDMYDGPMQDIVNGSSDVSFTHNFPASYGYSSSVNRSSLFHPDRVASHGRMTRGDYEKYLDDMQYALDQNTLPPFLKAGQQSAIDAQRAAYGVDPSISEGSRLNYVFSTGERSEWGPADLHPCLDANNCSGSGGPHDAIYAPSNGLNDVQSLMAAYYAPYLAQQVADTNPAYTEFWEVPRAQLDASTLVGGNSSFYQFYKNVERTTPALLDTAATDGHSNNGAIPYTDQPDPDGGPALNPEGYGTFGIQSGAMNYAATYGAAAIPDTERRVQRMTVVNCEAAVDYATATGEGSSDFADTWMAEIVDVVDVYLATPPMVRACDAPVSGDVHNNNLCPNEEIADVELEVEMVDAASINPVNFDSRYYAVLIH